MFEDIEESIGLEIKAKIFEAFGCYPILDVSEHWEMFDPEVDEEPYVLRDYHALLDTEHLDKIGDFELFYVTRLFEGIIRAKLADKAHLDTSASKKYCFSDTEDWWVPMVIKEDTFPSGRARFELIVELG